MIAKNFSESEINSEKKSFNYLGEEHAQTPQYFLIFWTSILGWNVVENPNLEANDSQARAEIIKERTSW